MLTVSELIAGFDEVILDKGYTITLKYFPTITHSGAGYDEEFIASASGITISGGAMVLPISNNEKGYVDMGKLEWKDKTFYVTGSLITGSGAFTINYAGSIYMPLTEGIFPYEVSGTTIYKKIFMRWLPAGSLPGLY